jgi:diadenosine tetraphosphate (Ap4A) HIT family hydrolase
MTRTWPEDWESRKRGDSCFFCADLSDRSFYSGRTSEALLERRAIAVGHTAVVFRGRHVADLGDLKPEELADVDYMLLGNIVPHLHVHVVPRYLDDSAPGLPLPWAPSPVPEDVFDRQFAQLQDLSRELTREE